MTSLERKWFLLFLTVGVVLRLALYLVTPPKTQYDDHYEPILYFMRDGAMPPKNACWECNQPPVFYAASGIAGKAIVPTGAKPDSLFKFLQSIPLVYGILTLPIIYLILLRFPFPIYARILTFGIVCLLPQHIYACVLHSNDTMASLFVALSVLVFLIAIEKKFAPRWLLLWSAVISITIFTKYTALAILPASFAGCLLVIWFTENKKRIALTKKFASALLLPGVLLAWYSTANIQEYGHPLPDNQDLLNVRLNQTPGPGKINFLDFKPWTMIETPVITPENVGSFWTLIYAHMWFDIEPKFIIFSDLNHPYWKSYWLYLRFQQPYPGTPPLSTLTSITSRGLMLVGLLPLLLICLGVAYCFVRWNDELTQGKNPLAAKIIPLSIFFLVNAIGIILYTVKHPFFSQMKGIYFLGSLPFFALFCCLGLLFIDKFKPVRYIFTVLLGCLFILATIHIIQITVFMR